MKEFMSLRDFLLLRDPTDLYNEPAYYGAPMLFKNQKSGASYGMDCVDRYDIAKNSWEQYGEEGPPFGSKVEMLVPGHGGDVGSILTFDGIYPYDTRFFQVYRTRKEYMYDRTEKLVSLVVRKIWFVAMRVHNE